MTRTRVSLPELPQAPTFDDRKWDALTKDERVSVLDWAVDVCLVSGSERTTAYVVAALLSDGFENDRRTLTVYRTGVSSSSASQENA